MAQIAAAVIRGRKKRVQSQDEFMRDILDDFFESEDGFKAAERAKSLEEKATGKLEGTRVAFDIEHKKSLKHEKQIDGLLQKVTDRMSRSVNYNSFASICVFFALYLSAVLLQQNVSTENTIQTAFQETIIKGACGGEFCAGSRLGDPQEIFDWLQEDIVDRAWDEPVCGDGTCEWDGNEYPGFGRFGCIEDCGRYLFTTQITVDLNTFYNASRKMLRKPKIKGIPDDQTVGWNLEKLMNPDRKPDFKWNLFSKTMGDFLLAEDAAPEDGPVVLEVPDGELELYLYQTTSMADMLDITDITTNRAYGPKIRPSSVPERAAGISDFFYGDKREALASQSELVAQLFDHCWGGPFELTNFDWNCWSPFDEQFIEMFGAYGMNGTIKMGNGSRSTMNLVEVPFCGITPNGIRGLKVVRWEDMTAAEQANWKVLGHTESSWNRDPGTNDPATRKKSWNQLCENGFKRSAGGTCDACTTATCPAGTVSEKAAAAALGYDAAAWVGWKHTRWETGDGKMAIENARETSCSSSSDRRKYVPSKTTVQADKTNLPPSNLERMRKALDAHPVVIANRARSLGGGARRSLLADPNNTITDGSSAHWVLGLLSGTSTTCKEHKDCDQYVGHSPRGWPSLGAPLGKNAFEKLSGGPGQFCAKDGECEMCGHCQQNSSAFETDGCPQDLCPGSGNMPSCISAEKLMANWQCPERYKFSVWKYFKETPQVILPAKTKTRLMTPFNRLVGSVLVSTTRRSETSCVAGGNSTATPGVRNADVIAFVTNIEHSSTCLGADADSRPYGVDPVLIPTSSIYDGKAMFKSAYGDAERADLNGVDTGFGFFNHSYDTTNQRLKDSSLINDDYAESFNVYIDSRSTLEQATNYVTYLRESGFLDEFTESVQVQFVTMNIDSNIFAHLQFLYEWDKGGSIEWDWSMTTVQGPPVYRWGGSGSTSAMQLPLEVVCMVFLAINCILELRDMVTAFRIMRPQSYFLDGWNWIDLVHFGVMWSAWIRWVSYTNKSNLFTMQESYPGVSDPYAGLRYFQTNATEEANFLGFLGDVSELASDYRAYSELVGASILLFVIRVIKNLDFQERMGLISRTIVAAIPNIAHFSVLFGLVFYGYLVVAHVLFGHSFESFSTMEDGATFLFLTMLIGWDPVDFWTQMENAAEKWVFYIFIYSLMLILFFILFNVLLGILIDTYCEMKEEVNPEASSFLPEMTSILQSNLFDWIIDSKKRMPDAKFKEILLEHKAGLPSLDVLKSALEQSTAPPPTILLPGGVEIDGPTMRKLIARMSEEKLQRQAVSLEAFHDHDSEDEEQDEEDQDEEEWVKMPDGSLKKRTKEKEKAIYVDEDEERLVMDIVERYASESAIDDGKKDEDEMLMLQLESMKREMALFRGAQITHQRVLAMEEQLDRMALAVLPPEERLPKPVVFGGRDKALGLRNQLRGLIRVSVVEARGLPAMDILGATDPYALVFLSEPFSDSVTGPVTFRTETISNNRNPVWNADFELPLFPHAETLTVAVFDHDSITKDDLIGVCNVHLSELEVWVQSDKWIQLTNSKMSSRRIASAEVRIKVTRLPDAKQYLAQAQGREEPSLEPDAEDAHVLEG